MNVELLRTLDNIARDKNIDRESIFTDLEAAMESAARKHFGSTEEVDVKIDRETGEITAFLAGEQIDIRQLGRIPAQTAKQVMIQKLREDERGSIFAEFQERVGEVVAGSVARFESGTTIVSLGRTEAILPRSEQIPGETHHPGERIRAMIYEVKEAPHQVKIILSRTHPDFIRRLFEQEVPEVADRIIEIRALAREAGYRTKVAVNSLDNKVDAVGACVGVRGSRIKNIVDELGGEKIDIVRWNESSQIFIGNALRPSEIREIALCFELNRATVVVSDDQLSLAIGKRGQNVRLAARLTNWDIDILTPPEYSQGIETLIKTLRSVERIDDTTIDKVMALGIISVLDLEEIGPEPLIHSLELDEELAVNMVKTAAEEARRLAESKGAATAAQAVLAQEVSKGKPARKPDLASLVSSVTIDNSNDNQDESPARGDNGSLETEASSEEDRDKKSSTEETE
ncbi:MAG: transcription termination/antitermination protein NusA [Sedimentisphaerales bacterium]|nr:transcription termination/antitermination protein NusA [Sedimentisphaerales bacterium]